MSDDDAQRVVRVPGARRARLTPVPGTDPSPEAGTPSDDEAPRRPASVGKGPNDQQLLQDVPPHY